MNIHSYVENSSVNGPGNRFVLWTQGCNKACKNCFNPETWSYKNNLILNTNQIFEIIDNLEVDGITFTGGDPLEQSEEMLDLLKKLNLKKYNKGIIVFTGYTLDEINKIGGSTKEILNYIDLLIDGRFEEKYKITKSLRGSSNQNFHFFSNKLKNEEIEFDQKIEIGVNNSNLYITGFPFINKKILKSYGLKII